MGSGEKKTGRWSWWRVARNSGEWRVASGGKLVARGERWSAERRGQESLPFPVLPGYRPMHCLEALLRGGRTANRTRVYCSRTPNFWAPACTHPSPVAALALRPSGACQTYQSPPQPPGPRSGPPEGWAAVGFVSPASFHSGVVGAFAEGFGALTSDFGVGKSQDLGFLTALTLA